MFFVAKKKAFVVWVLVWFFLGFLVLRTSGDFLCLVLLKSLERGYV